MRTGLRNHRRHQRTERDIASAKAGKFAADVLEGNMDTIRKDTLEYRSDLMQRIEEARARLLGQMSDDERESVKDMPAWTMPYDQYHQTLVDAGRTDW